MKLSEVKPILNMLEKVVFKLEDGTFVPEHFHVTEVGQVTKHFIDCGGTIRKEKVVSFQLWYANDLDHRLNAKKLLNIIALSERKLGLEDGEIEVEYQNQTIGKYHLAFDGQHFILQNTNTACLASDKCGIPQENSLHSSDLQIIDTTCCSSDKKCC